LLFCELDFTWIALLKVYSSQNTSKTQGCPVTKKAT
jgi:hypothetical protein